MASSLGVSLVAVQADARDPFPRRTATPARLAPWLIEVGRTLPGLLRSYLPGRALDPP